MTSMICDSFIVVCLDIGRSDLLSKRMCTYQMGEVGKDFLGQAQFYCFQDTKFNI